MTDLDARKAVLRGKLKERRAAAAAANGAAVAALAADRFLAAVPLRAGQAVAGYWPMADELDPRPLLDALRQCGVLVLLPCVVAKAQPLAFRRWDEDVAPPPGRYGIPAPPDHLPALRPDILLVPLVGFDAEGHRLGMGGGFYDATLEALRGDGLPLLAAGYAFAVQQVAELPHGAMDERLDLVVTERGAIDCHAEGGQTI
ncbi:5-formyltetrahydrofolate cyclo-ligase [Ferrovibrio xuzhouensis]|uniref:5-formyltetrahydrofolate cyclo-ligase n=1 Tax=Ferrovibrio xuzhouensis TaxID=1576914 RepID=A0ABV7VBX7_9PROT